MVAVLMLLDPEIILLSGNDPIRSIPMSLQKSFFSFFGEIFPVKMRKDEYKYNVVCTWLVAKDLN